MTDKEKALFESYNSVIEECYNRAFTESSQEDLLKVKERAVAQYLELGLAQWEKTPLKELDGQTPREVIGHYTGFEEVLELFKLGTVLSDKDIPDILTERLKSFGEPAVDWLIETIQEEVQEENDLYIQLAAIKVAGEWRVEKAIGPLLERVKRCKPEDELIMEAGFAAFVNIGTPVMELLVQELNDAGEITYYHEYIILALAEIGRENKDDSLYRSLKNAFLRMDGKIIGAAALATYGDGRAVPALRGYMEKYKNTMNAETFYEIKTAVEKLGGSIDDIAVPRFVNKG